MATGTVREEGAAPPRRRWWGWVTGPELVVSLLVLAVGAAIYAYAHKDEGRLAASKERGSEIVAALQQYRGDHALYPAALNDLVPRYLDSIPQPSWGLGRWRYERIVRPAAGAVAADSMFFMLSVAASSSGYPLLFYDITAGRWVLNN